jgi:hypothetical protein
MAQARMAPTESFWPTASQRLLRTVAFGDEERSGAAWTALKPKFDLDRLEPGSFTIMPLVYRALAAAAPAEPLLPRLKGIYRSIWARNTLLLERTAETFDAFEQQGIPALALGGLPLGLRYYSDLGSRRTENTVALAAQSDAHAIPAALAAARWFPRPDLDAWHGAAARAPRYFADRDGNILVVVTSLGFDVLLESEPREALGRFLPNAGTQTVGTAQVGLPSLTDALFALCVSGPRVGPLRSVQWLVDAATLIRSTGGEIDWARFVSLGLESRQALRLTDAVAQIAAVPDVRVPDGVVDELRGARATRRDRLIFRGSGRATSRLGALPLFVAEHLAAHPDTTPATAVLSLPGYLRERWSLGSLRAVPLAASRKAIRALTGRRRSDG